ncbi:uncharacterized protein Fa2h [Battus philenor]|uniref:uncharacterized protein Fa2h n=1 Tax=Battus philenor TaxID=42288 RepID=UPI0035D12086
MFAKNNGFMVAFNDNSYDLKRFLHDHPGGRSTLEKYKGKSIVQAMKMYDHSSSAYHMMSDFKVSEGTREGNLAGAVSGNGRIITKEEVHRNPEEIAFLEELEGRLDWSKPLLSQLSEIAPHYEKWVHTAVYRQCKLFSNPLLESLTYTSWYLVPIFWIPIIFYLIVTTYDKYVACGDSCGPENISTLQYLKYVISGTLLWTIFEYAMHRWVFHFNPGTSHTMIKIHFLIHGIHHKVPFDGLRQVFPPVPALILAAIVYIAVSKIITYPMIRMIGGLIGYLCYDMIHYYLHHCSPSAGSYLYEMKRYHSNHHFLNHDKAFGITSKIWDRVFKTFVHVKRLGFSLRW